MEKVKKEKKNILAIRRPERQKTLSLLRKKEVNKVRLPIFEMMIVIVNRGKGDDVVSYLKSLNVELDIVSFGSGTAPSNLANLFSLYNKEKEVIFTVIRLEDSEKILDSLEKDILTNEKFAGIAFTVPLKCMTNGSIDRLSQVKEK